MTPDQTRHDDRFPAALTAGQLPHSPEAESALLGAMCIDGNAVGDVLQIIRGVEDFHIAHNAAIAGAIVGLYDAGTPIDAVTIHHQLAAGGQDGGDMLDRLIAVMDSTPSAASVETYARTVADLAKLRRLMATCQDTIDSIRLDARDTDAIVDTAEAAILEATEERGVADTYAIGDLADAAYQRIERGEPAAPGLRTGWVDLDKTLRGLRAGNLIIVAGRTSMGKTCLGVHLATRLSIDRGVPAAVITLEMSREELGARILSAVSGVPSERIDAGGLDAAECSGLALAVGTLRGGRLFVVDRPGLTLMQLRAKARRLVSKHSIEVLVVDYLQLVREPNARTRREEVSAVSRGLKSLAGELEIPIVAMAQLNRQPDARDGHRPRMSDLKESGDIEQDADVVLLLHREAYFHADDAQWRADNQDKLNLAEVIVAKQRNGPTGTATLVFDPTRSSFHDMRTYT